jgi:hypothetical protein
MEKECQKIMTPAYKELAVLIGADIAPVGEVWHEFVGAGNDNSMLYQDDGNHAKPLGSYLAGAVLFYTLTGRRDPLKVRAEDEPSRRLGLDIAVCRQIHELACKKAGEYRC